MRVLAKLGVTLALIAVGVLGCEREEPGAKVGGPYYYGRANLMPIPPVPKEEITEAEAKQRGSYYLAHFNDHGAF
jgi:hypothetical protein